MCPYVGPTSTGAGSSADDFPNPVILETGGEHIGRAIALRVGDQHDRSVILLTDLIASRHGREWKTLRKGGGSLDRLLNRGGPWRKLRQSGSSTQAFS